MTKDLEPGSKGSQIDLSIIGENKNSPIVSERSGKVHFMAPDHPQGNLEVEPPKNSEEEKLDEVVLTDAERSGKVHFMAPDHPKTELIIEPHIKEDENISDLPIIQPKEIPLND